MPKFLTCKCTSASNRASVSCFQVFQNYGYLLSVHSSSQVLDRQYLKTWNDSRCTSICAWVSDVRELMVWKESCSPIRAYWLRRTRTFETWIAPLPGVSKPAENMNELIECSTKRLGSKFTSWIQRDRTGHAPCGIFQLCHNFLKNVLWISVWMIHHEYPVITSSLWSN